MRYEVRCKTCLATGWPRGSEEWDTNAFDVREEDLDEICEHLANGGEYEGTGGYEDECD